MKRISSVFIVVMSLLSISAAAEEQKKVYRQRLPHQEVRTFKQPIADSPDQLLARRERFVERQEKLQEIITALTERRLAPAQAKKQLEPLIKEEVKQDLETADIRIAYLQDQLADLEKLRQNPEQVVQERLKKILDAAGQMPHTGEAL